MTLLVNESHFANYLKTMDVIMEEEVLLYKFSSLVLALGALWGCSLQLVMQALPIVTPQCGHQIAEKLRKLLNCQGLLENDT